MNYYLQTIKKPVQKIRHLSLENVRQTEMNAKDLFELRWTKTDLAHVAKVTGLIFRIYKIW